MNKKRIRELKSHFYHGLLENTMAFWEQHGIDREYGGYHTMLDRKGAPLSVHKSMWIHGRFTWLLARLYSAVEPRREWLDLALHGIDFMKKYGFDQNGRMYFTVDRSGEPVRMRRYLFTEIFAVMGFAEYYRASGDSEALDIAIKTLHVINDLKDTPERLNPKYHSSTFPIMGHAMAMIQINMFQVLRQAHPEGDYTPMIDQAIHQIMTCFVKENEKVLLEIVAPDGSIMRDLPEGRCVNPGHAIETAWFIMEEGKYRNDKTLIEKALSILDWSLERGWDPEHGGLFAFVDLDGLQPVQIEWDMKYWWPHNESLYATLLAYSLTGDNHYEKWFEKIHAWSEAHFPDHMYGEWFGYLHRDGSLALDLKASGWKGPFHLPRQQLHSYKLLTEMGESQATSFPNIRRDV